MPDAALCWWRVKNQSLSTERLRQKAIERVTQAIQYYWSLCCLAELEVQNEAVHLAKQQYESNFRQAEQGMLAPIEVVAAQTQVRPTGRARLPRSRHSRWLKTT